jgi:hypothetical protein
MPTNLNSSLPLLTEQGFLLSLWLLALVFLVLFFIFSLIVMRQVFLMTGIIMASGGWLLRLIAVLYSFFVLGTILIVILNFMV